MLELSASNVNIGFDFGHDFNLEFSKVKYWTHYISGENGLIATKKNEHIDWMLGLKCDPQFWIWP